MAKESFTGPFWFLIGLGAITTVSHTYGLYLISTLGRQVSVVYKILFYFWTYVVFAEAIVYWRMRYRNVYRAASWGHVWLMALALLSPAVVYSFVGFFSRFYSYSNYLTFYRAVQMGLKVALYGGLFIGHALFIKVLVKVRASKKVGFVEESENLLDDIID